MPEPCIFAGRSTIDLAYLVDHFPEQDTKVFAYDFRAQAGGPALNAAITYASLGGDATLISAVGHGRWARLIHEELATYGVKLVDICADPAYDPPITSVIVNRAAATRTIFNPPLLPAAGAQLMPGKVSSARMMLTDGFLESELSGYLRSYAESGGVICLDGGSWKDTTEQLLPSVSIAICNERFRPPGVSGPEEIIVDLAQRGVRQVAVTRGPEAILGCDRGRRFAIQVDPVEAVDTLGAGDILHGAFCRFFLETGDFERALSVASQVAAFSCRYFGTREWMQYWKPAAACVAPMVAAEQQPPP